MHMCGVWCAYMGGRVWGSALNTRAPWSPLCGGRGIIAVCSRLRGAGAESRQPGRPGGTEGAMLGRLLRLSRGLQPTWGLCMGSI